MKFAMRSVPSALRSRYLGYSSPAGSKVLVSHADLLAYLSTLHPIHYGQLAGEIDALLAPLVAMTRGRSEVPAFASRGTALAFDAAAPRIEMEMDTRHVVRQASLGTVEHGAQITNALSIEATMSSRLAGFSPGAETTSGTRTSGSYMNGPLKGSPCSPCASARRSSAMRSSRR